MYFDGIKNLVKNDELKNIFNLGHNMIQSRNYMMSGLI